MCVCVFFLAGKTSRGCGAPAQAVEVIVKGMERIESGLFMEDPMMQIMN